MTEKHRTFLKLVKRERELVDASWYYTTRDSTVPKKTIVENIGSYGNQISELHNATVIGIIEVDKGQPARLHESRFTWFIDKIHEMDTRDLRIFYDKLTENEQEIYLATADIELGEEYEDMGANTIIKKVRKDKTI